MLESECRAAVAWYMGGCVSVRGCGAEEEREGENGRVKRRGVFKRRVR